MYEIENSPYAAWLEGAVGYIFEQKPEKICLCATMAGGETMTAYYHCDAQDKAVLAHHINSDAMLDVVLLNAGLIKEALDALEEGGRDG